MLWWRLALLIVKHVQGEWARLGKVLQEEPRLDLEELGVHK